MGIAVKIFTLDSEANLTLGTRVALNQGKYYMYKSVGNKDPIRVEVLEKGELVWFAYLSEFSFPGEQNWEHQKILIPLPGSLETVRKQVVDKCILITPDETILIRKDEVKFLKNQTAVFFQNGISPTFH